MTFSKFVLTLTIPALLAFPITAHADTSRCGLSAYQPTQVAPLYELVPAGHGGGTERLSGAQLFVPAHAGLTAEWLRANLERHIVDMKQHPMTGCPLANGVITIAVVSGGTGFWVQISTKNTDTAKSILQQARSLVQ